jgi:hypothetical protein
MRQTGFNVISAQADPGYATEAGVKFYDTCLNSTGLRNSIYHWPENAQTWNESDHLGIPALNTIKLMQDQMDACGGYSVIMMHFEEFKDSSDGILQSQMNELDLVLTEALASGCSVKTLKDLGASNIPTAKPQPTSAPTSGPTVPTVVTSSPTKSPTTIPSKYPKDCKIAFRLDDVQEFWLVDIQIALMNLFISRGVPLSIGIFNDAFACVDIASKTPCYFIRTELSKGVNTSLEIVNHGRSISSIANLTLAQQLQIFQTISAALYGVGSKLPQNPSPIVSFIPPVNAFSEVTLEAMRLSNYTTISGLQASLQAVENLVYHYYDLCSISTGLRNSLYHFPQKAIIHDENTHLGITANKTIKQIQDQIANCNGYSVVAINFQYFANNVTGALLQNQYNELDAILTEVKSSGCVLSFLRDLGTITKSPTKAPTKAPTKPTTTKAPTKAPTSKSSILRVNFLLLILVLIQIFSFVH